MHVVMSSKFPSKKYSLSSIDPSKKLSSIYHSVTVKMTEMIDIRP
jgi:hypothetical protein